MATASPTPMGQGSHFSSLGRRISARQALRRPPSRAAVAHSDLQPIPDGRGSPGHAQAAAQSQSRQYATAHDSSDDEIPVPMKLSALTKAILNDNARMETSSAALSLAGGRTSPPGSRRSSLAQTRHRSGLGASTSSATEDRGSEGDGVKDRATKRHSRTGSGHAQQPTSSRLSSPVRSRENSPAPRKRIVRLSATTNGGAAAAQNPLRRSLSTSTASQRSRRPANSQKNEEQPVSQALSQPLLPSQQPARQAVGLESADLSTPAQPVRTVRIAVGSSGGNRARSMGSSSGVSLSSKPSANGVHSDHDQPEEPGTAARAAATMGQASVTRQGVMVGKKEEGGPQSSMRVKRVGKLAGSFLSGPARRGRRRQSEEEGDDMEPPGSVAPAASDQPGQHAEQPHGLVESSFRDFAASGSPVSSRDANARKQSPFADLAASRNYAAPAHKASAAAPRLPSFLDQENMPIPIIPKSVATDAVYLLDKGPLKPFPRPHSVVEPAAHHRAMAGSPERKVLAVKSQNTPHRPAPPPPPPKMSVVETATKPAGAATTAQGAKKRTLLLKVNNVPYTRIDCLGRGGSGKVYKVAAENGKMYALKRVSLEHADENIVKGIKGEIDLLKQLADVERVIRLVDFELNVEKQILSLVLEQGEMDFYRLLGMRQNQEGARMDPVFVRYYWKEMLECVAAVHVHNIVHSDLKPANFVLVQGRLKLIDFGIANAIQTDETVNVHRETQIGTPNYMSPESLMDTNQYAFTSSHNGRFCIPPGLNKGGPKLVKLGKPSDVWSLGCILYQMVYGKLPFGHIANPVSRCQAIINWNHPIEFPSQGMGGVSVPQSLQRTMRACLDRDQTRRPSCDSLLSGSDPFLYPQEFALDVLAEGGNNKALPITEEILGRIIASVVSRCKERLPTEGEYLSAWPGAYFSSVRKAVEYKPQAG